MRSGSLRIHVFGAVYGDPVEPSYITEDGTPVWMWRKGQRVRFLTADGLQVGPEQANVFPAVCAAAAAGWIDPANPWLSAMATAEVRAKSRPVVRGFVTLGTQAEAERYLVALDGCAGRTVKTESGKWGVSWRRVAA